MSRVGISLARQFRAGVHVGRLLLGGGVDAELAEKGPTMRCKAFSSGAGNKVYFGITRCITVSYGIFKCQFDPGLDEGPDREIDCD